MFDKCLKCERIGESCVPNLMLLPFSELIQWCNKRQKHLEWSNQTLANNSKVPIGTINRIKAGEYLDCKYSTIKHLLIALIGGTTDEFSCTEQVTRELRQIEELEEKAAKFTEIEAENEKLKAELLSLKEKELAFTKENEILRLKLEHKDEIITLHNYIMKLKPKE